MHRSDEHPGAVGAASVAVGVPGSGAPAHRRTRRALDDELVAAAGRRSGIGGAVKWMGSAQLGTQIIRILGTVVLARLLTPADFGVVALVMVIAGLVEQVLGDTGTTTALVRHDRVTHRLASSVLWWNVLIGTLTTAGFAVFAVPLAALLGERDAAGVTRVIGCLALVNATGYVHTALFRRNLLFKRVAVVNLANVIVTMGATMALALLGWGAWALAVGTLVGSAVAAVVAWAWSDWRPSLHFSWADLAPIRGFSARLSLQNLFTYTIQVGDRFLVGRLLGVVDLGYYGMANRLVNYPLQTSAQTFREVVFPNLARMQGDDDAIRDTYRRMVAATALVLVPACLTLAAVADPLVRLVLGPKWVPAIPLISIIAVVGALQSLGTTTGTVFMAKGRADLLLRWSGFSAAVLLACYAVGSRWGVTGVGMGFLIGIALLTYPAFHLALGLLGVRPWYLARAVLPSIGCAVAGAGAALATVRGLAAVDQSDLVRLAAGLAVSFVVTSNLLLLVRPEALRDVLRMTLRRRRGRRGPAAERPPVAEHAPDRDRGRSRSGSRSRSPGRSSRRRGCRRRTI